MNLPVCATCGITVYLRMNGEWAHSVPPGHPTVHTASPNPNDFTRHLLDPKGMHEAHRVTTHSHFPVHMHETEGVVDIRKVATMVPVSEQYAKDMGWATDEVDIESLRRELEATRLLLEAGDRAVVAAVNRRAQASRKVRSMLEELDEGVVADDLTDILDILEGGETHAENH